MKPLGRESLLPLAILGGVLFVLSSGIDGMGFSEGYRVDFSTIRGHASAGGGAPAVGSPIAFVAVMATFVVAALVSVLISMRTRDGRRRLLVNAAIIVVAMFALGALSNVIPELQPPEEEAREHLGQRSGLGVPRGLSDGDSGFRAPGRQAPPPVLPYLIALIPAVAAAAVAYRLTRSGAEEEGDGGDVEPGAELERAAEQARVRLADERSDVDLVRTSYRDLEALAATRLGSARAVHCSPRAFVRTLVELGLPQDAVEELVALFEEVRYGDLEPDRRRESRARQALAAIVAAADEATARGDDEPSDA